MIGGLLDNATLTGLGVLIAALASLVSAVGTVWNNAKLNKVGRDVAVVKRNGKGNA